MSRLYEKTIQVEPPVATKPTQIVDKKSTPKGQ
jgi:hypothetical protein